jgi:hypothetical protein
MDAVESIAARDAPAPVGTPPAPPSAGGSATTDGGAGAIAGVGRDRLGPGERDALGLSAVLEPAIRRP